MNMKKVQQIVNSEGIIFLSYGGFLSQSMISAMTEALEKETEESKVKMGISTNIFTVFIELSQNMMNYSKSEKISCDDIVPGGLIIVSKNIEQVQYDIDSYNIISKDDKDKIEQKLIKIKSLNKDEIKKEYRKLRRNGRGTHAKGGGIGFYEIAKRCDKLDFNFDIINDERYYFHIKATIKNK